MLGFVLKDVEQRYLFRTIRWLTCKMLKRARPDEGEIHIGLITEAIERPVLRLLKVEFGGLGRFRTRNFGYGLPFGILVFVRRQHGPEKNT